MTIEINYNEGNNGEVQVERNHRKKFNEMTTRELMFAMCGWRA